MWNNAAKHLSKDAWRKAVFFVLTFNQPITQRGGLRAAVSVAVAAFAITAVIHSAAVPAGAAEIHVPADHATIQQAINAASKGDEIIVASGTYNEAINFAGKSITVRSADGAAVTVIDATGIASSVVSFTNGEEPQTVLDGFTLTGGVGNDFGGLLYGGGVFADSGSSPTIMNCIVRGNSADIGGAFAHLNLSSPLIVNCLIIENTASGQGGGGTHFFHSNPTYVNCTFAANYAPFGSAIDIATFCTPTLINCILWNNSDDFEGKWQISGFPIVRDSIVEGGFGGDNVIDEDPLFVDAQDDNYRVASGSPAIDAGDTSAVPSGVTTDLDGNPRIINRIVDMGAYELQPSQCLGDITDSLGGEPDGVVNGFDLLALLSCWGSVGRGGDCDHADFTDSTGGGPDGMVNGFDLLVLLANWGPCPCP